MRRNMSKELIGHVSGTVDQKDAKCQILKKKERKEKVRLGDKCMKQVPLNTFASSFDTISLVFGLQL